MSNTPKVVGHIENFKMAVVETNGVLVFCFKDPKDAYALSWKLLEMPSDCSTMVLGKPDVARANAEEALKEAARILGGTIEEHPIKE